MDPSSFEDRLGIQVDGASGCGLGMRRGCGYTAFEMYWGGVPISGLKFGGSLGSMATLYVEDLQKIA